MHSSVMDGVIGVKVAVEWNGIFPALQGGRGNAKTFSFRSHRPIRRPKLKVHLPTSLQLLATHKAGRRQPNRWDGAVSSKKTKTKQQHCCFSGIDSFLIAPPTHDWWRESAAAICYQRKFKSKRCKSEIHQDKGSKVHNLSYALACRFARFAVIFTVLASSNNSDDVWCACFAQTVHGREEYRKIQDPWFTLI